ncbi:hypothetical protein EVAR_41096_1 [Eumeta japonica]|uniref:Uncharacterized protein n=1 Tax=Eumeta variegata TaxID=151549 RepID=A0A4C1XET7_EUMVA|nr:hypothetical protein EVAR_41096_1 [Eumeta japonica]
MKNGDLRFGRGERYGRARVSNGEGRPAAAEFPCPHIAQRHTYDAFVSQCIAIVSGGRFMLSPPRKGPDNVARDVKSHGSGPRNPLTPQCCILEPDETGNEEPSRKRKTYKNWYDPFTLEEEKFKNKCRFTKAYARYVVELVRENIVAASLPSFKSVQL